MTRESNFKLVEEFMFTFGQDVHYIAGLRDSQLRELRYNLIAEELGELKEALEKRDIIEVADALTDLLYVIYGAGHAFGINLDLCFEEVHASNMSKLDSKGKPIYREDGKVQKGPHYIEPFLDSVLFLKEAQDGNQ